MRTAPKVAAVALGVSLLVAGCGSTSKSGTSPSTAGVPSTAGSTAVTGPSSTAAPTAAPVTALTAAVRADLVFVHEQERVGSDAFAVFAARYPSQPVFGNLAKSQTTQVATVTAMMSRYGVPDPSSGLAAGKYSDSALQKVYDSMVATATSDHALDAVEHFEEQNAASLRAAQSHTTSTDLVTMYTNLERASTAHVTACNEAHH